MVEETLGKASSKRKSSANSSGNGSVDRQSGSGLVAVELTSLPTAAAVDLSIETVAAA